MMKLKRKSDNVLIEKKNGNTTFQSLWDAAKTVLREKFIVILTFLKKQEKSQINNLTYHLKELEKDTCTPMFIAALFTIARSWKQPKCLSTDEWIKKMWYTYIQWNITQP